MGEGPGTNQEHKPDLVLLAMGFVAPVAAVLDAFGIDKDARGNAKASMDEVGGPGRTEQGGASTAEWNPLKDLAPASGEPLQPPMQTLQIVGGRKEKIRPGDVLGALTKDLGFAGTQIGKINVNEFSTYVAVERSIATQVLRKLSAGKVKGRSVELRLLES